MCEMKNTLSYGKLQGREGMDYPSCQEWLNDSADADGFNT